MELAEYALTQAETSRTQEVHAECPTLAYRRLERLARFEHQTAWLLHRRYMACIEFQGQATSGYMGFLSEKQMFLRRNQTCQSMFLVEES